MVENTDTFQISRRCPELYMLIKDMFKSQSLRTSVIMVDFENKIKKNT